MTHETNDPGADQRLSVSRRTVVKGAAWSVPAIVVASQAPAMAASPPVTIDFGDSTACKLPGSAWKQEGYKWGYVLWANFVNSTGQTVYVSVDSMIIDNIVQCVVGMTDPTEACPATGPTATDCMEVPEGESYVAIWSNANQESSSGSLQITLTWYAAANCTGTPMGTTDPPLTATLTGGPLQGANCTLPPGTVCDLPPTVATTDECYYE